MSKEGPIGISDLMTGAAARLVIEEKSADRTEFSREQVRLRVKN